MRSIILCLAAGAALAPTGAAARSAYEASEEDIVVTASRGGERTQASLGGSVTILSSDTLELRQARDLNGVLRDVPGVAVGAVPGQTQLRLRGSEANHVLFLIDGIEASDPFTGEFDASLLAIDENARVEILRGQQSALYGSDAIGGVVHYLTASGREAPGWRVRAEGGSFGAWDGAARAGGAIGEFDYALTATASRRDGAPNAHDGARDLERQARAFSARFNWRLHDDVRLSAVMRTGRAEGDFNESEANPASPDFGLIVDSPGLRFETEAAFGLARADISSFGGMWEHSLIVQGADTERATFRFASQASGSEGERLKGSYESRLAWGDQGLRQTLTFAVDAERESFRNVDPSGFAFSGERNVESTGIVLDYAAALGERTHFGVALRRDDNELFDDATTWRAQFSHVLTPRVRLRAAAGAGVKNPGYYELFGFVDGRYVGNPNLRPERSLGWEAGADFGLFDGVDLGVTYFDAVLEDEIFTTFPAPTFVATPSNRTTDSVQRGVEVSAAARLSEAWKLDFSYTWLRARESGLDEVRRPEHAASLALDWRALGENGGVALVARYVGESVDLAFTDPSFVPRRVQLASGVTVGIYGDLALNEHVEAFARIENLTDDDREDVFSFRPEGRAAYAGLRAKF